MPQTSNIQVRIDLKTKRDVQKILEQIGLDVSTAVKVLFKQIQNTGGFPLEIRDVNGFRSHKAEELREAIKEADNNICRSKTFSSSKDLIEDLLSD